MREREYTDEECERQSRRARELNLAQYLRPGYHGPWWSARELALLGQLPDAEVAKRTGRTRNAVTVKRNRLRIPTARDGRRRG
jgi:hypothetical protein